MINHKVFETQWDLIFNIGIKCNAAPISQKLGQRYISSPFDNMDSVCGLAEAGNLIANRFENYFQNREKWHLRNGRESRNDKIRLKMIWHEDYPNLFYPHFYEGWLSNITKDEINNWIEDENGTIDFVWAGFSQVYSNRQKRLLDIMDRGKKILFLRIDERPQLKRLEKTNGVVNDTLFFCETIKKAYPNLNFGFLYLYSQPGEIFPPVLNDTAYFEPLPLESDEAAYAESFLRQLKVNSRESLNID
jgi:hypothetical protein